MVWAEEANAYVCSTVMPEGPTALDGQELDGSYYTAAVPVVQLQVARAGYRYVIFENDHTSGRCRVLTPLKQACGMDEFGRSWFQAHRAVG